MNARRLSVHLLVCLALSVVWSGPVFASSNLPLHHWGYDAIERLIALGVIDRALVGAKPFTRMQAAQFVSRAIERVRADEIDIGKTIHPHPTLGESIGMAAEVAHGTCTDLPPQKKAG